MYTFLPHRGLGFDSVAVRFEHPSHVSVDAMSSAAEVGRRLHKVAPGQASVRLMKGAVAPQFSGYGNSETAHGWRGVRVQILVRRGWRPLARVHHAHLPRRRVVHRSQEPTAESHALRARDALTE